MSSLMNATLDVILGDYDATTLKVPFLLALPFDTNKLLDGFFMNSI